MIIHLHPMTYKEYMTMKEVTYSAIGLRAMYSDDVENLDYYHVIDEQLFMLAVIKYGLRYSIV